MTWDKIWRTIISETKPKSLEELQHKALLINPLLQVSTLFLWLISFNQLTLTVSQNMPKKTEKRGFHKTPTTGSPSFTFVSFVEIRNDTFFPPLQICSIY